mmetsp:Transcript_78/g.95  ORF Transcript_78/g.95 Transcript_78/m.95 type:complete len:659 (+) Transcript_78:70-2046(+)
MSNDKYDCVDLPPCRLLFRSKEGIEVFPVQSSRDDGGNSVAARKFLLKGETNFQALLPDGSAALVHRPDKGIFKVDLREHCTSVENESDSPFFEKTSPVQVINVSPKGTFLLTWERAATNSDGPTNNLKVWNISTGECVTAFLRKTISRSSWPYLQWTHDENFAFLLTTNEIRIYNGSFPELTKTRYIDKIRIPGISSMSLPPSITTIDGGVIGGGILFAAFIAKDKNKPSRASLYEYISGTASSSPYPAIASKSLFQAEEMTVYWSPRGDVALISLQSSVDNTGESYYGSSSLYLMSQQTANDAIAVPLPQDGPVLDVAWMPNVERPPCFAVAAGKMPSMASLHNGRDGKCTFLFGHRHQNTVSWAPHGRFVNLAGFGNLAGGMTFWDKNKGKQIPPANPIVASCTVGFGWSPDSRVFLCSTTSPRMNVSNSVHIYRYNGDKVNNVPWNNDDYLPDRLLEATFIPATPDIEYPDRPQSPSLKDQGTGPDATATSFEITAAPKPTGRYVPPSARNRAGGGGGNSLADRIRAEKEGKMLGAQKVTNNKNSIMRGVVGTTGKVVIGLAPSEQKEGKSKSALRREKQQQRKKEDEARKELEAKQVIEQKKSDPVKRAKKINKTLRQIDELKQKDPSALNEDQIEKIATEQELRGELSKLKV